MEEVVGASRKVCTFSSKIVPSEKCSGASGSCSGGGVRRSSRKACTFAPTDIFSERPRKELLKRKNKTVFSIIFGTIMRILLCQWGIVQ